MDHWMATDLKLILRVYETVCNQIFYKEFEIDRISLADLRRQVEEEY